MADAHNVRKAKKKRFGLVVNCTADVPDVLPLPIYRVPVDDWSGHADLLLRHLPGAVQAIDAALSRGQKVLVHCYAGIQRSASVVAAYLMWKYGATVAEAMAHIQNSKPETFGPDPTFADALKQWEQVLASRRSR
jgi:dual specificity MAP kinase phosphatase